jgi:hypothetical protein
MTPTIEIDGHQWIVRAGVPCGTYGTLTSYLGRASKASTVGFVARHNLTILKHGKLSIVPKPQIDDATGATSLDQAKKNQSHIRGIGTG